jgi:ABC-type Zn uptake system ZnuABC Zn-binding protein ZnuA
MGASEAEELRVVTSTTDLASLVQKVGCDLVDVTRLARGYQHPHFVPGSALALLKLGGHEGENRAGFGVKNQHNSN